MKKKRLGCIELKIPCRKMVLIMKLSFFLFFCFSVSGAGNCKCPVANRVSTLERGICVGGYPAIEEADGIRFLFFHEF